MLTDYISGFAAAAEVIAWGAGCISAIVLALAALLVLAILAGAVFDKVTSILAKKWAQKERKPRNRFERVILAHWKQQGDRGEV